MTVITAGDALRFYLGDRANKTAVDLIVADKGPPSDLEIAELETYYAASLAAQRVKLEVWQFLTRAWTATWGEAMHAMPSAGLQSYGRHTDVFDLLPSLAAAWTSRQTYGVYRLPSGDYFATGLFLVENDQRVVLAYSMFDAEGGDIDPGFGPSVKWKINEENWFEFAPPASKLSKETFDLDLGPFRQCADEIVELLIDREAE